MTTHAPSPHSPVTARAAGRTTTRPPDSRPPAGPGRSRPSQPLPPRSWDPVRFRASDAVASRAAAHDLPRGEVNPIPGLAVKPLPDPSQWAAAVTQSAVEGLLGLRPVNQLSRWLAGPVYDQLTRRAGLALRVCRAEPVTGGANSLGGGLAGGRRVPRGVRHAARRHPVPGRRHAAGAVPRPLAGDRPRDRLAVAGGCDRGYSHGVGHRPALHRKPVAKSIGPRRAA